ncbi:tetratricopeptide repeat protein [Sansalvadorimonas sp. 2012CJ34-2]|uniref:Tetratricopeptide repeat protein n=1 Tax=Parendozoicomonas callyspongiae TaxID=2942213 RepID=A0ABT0PF46_9GAMM|nr:tetratricopeptide repeat protein [Sansalvadorimonas sp. 2012CJ34-2]MCL6269997.1 tetratricopeptide repeat protein [Sansalvadorimonas sp. 2012CJ34-2]
MGVLKRVLKACGIPAEGVGILYQGYNIARLKGMDDKLMAGIYALGHQHYQSENFESARNIMRYLSVHDHNNPEYLSALGACEYRLKNFPAALAVLEQAVELDSNDPRSMLNLALSLLKNGDKKQAKDIMKKARELASKQKEFAYEWKLANHILEGSGKKKSKRQGN